MLFISNIGKERTDIPSTAEVCRDFSFRLHWPRKLAEESDEVNSSPGFNIVWLLEIYLLDIPLVLGCSRFVAGQ